MYKTITLELIQDRPRLYEALRSSNRLLPAVESYAAELKTIHEAWRRAMTNLRPGSDPVLVAGEALELAIQYLLLDHFPSESPRDEAELTLEAAMDYLRRVTPPA